MVTRVRLPWVTMNDPSKRAVHAFVPLDDHATMSEAVAAHGTTKTGLIIGLIRHLDEILAACPGMLATARRHDASSRGRRWATQADS